MTTRGLVLSGGGPVGIAWQAGVLAGLAQAGVELADADRILGTSAGAVVGSHLALGVTAGELAERQRARGDRTVSEGAGEGGSGGAEASAPEIPDELIAAFLGDEEAGEETRKRIGTFALRAETGGEEDFVAGFGTRLARASWPEAFCCTAVEAETGRFAVLDRDAGVPLHRAVAASCAVPGIFPPVTLDGRRYMDGGVRSLASADLATGCDEVVVLSLVGGEGDGADSPLATRVERELEGLRGAGARVWLCTPDEEARTRIGVNLMDFRRAPEAVDAGVEQGRREAARLSG